MLRGSLIHLLGFIVLSLIVSATPAGAKDGDVIERGLVIALSSGAVTVNGKTFVINSLTKFEDDAGNPASFDDFSVGDYVKVKGRVLSGTLFAREIEKDDESNSGDDDHDDNPGKGSGNRHLRARLAQGEIPTGLRGQTRYRTRDGKRLVRRLTASVKLPIPSFSPQVTSVEEASNLDLRLNYFRDNQQIASCFLVFDRISVTSSGDESAQYKLDVRYRQKKGDDELRIHRGDCDTDLNLSGTQSGVPIIRRSDTVVLTLIEPEQEADYLFGTVKRLRDQR